MSNTGDALQGEMIKEIVLIPEAEHYLVRVLCQQRDKPLRKPQLKKAAIEMVEEVLEYLKNGQVSSGGFAGYSYEVRREDLLVESKGKG